MLDVYFVSLCNVELKEIAFGTEKLDAHKSILSDGYFEYNDETFTLYYAIDNANIDKFEFTKNRNTDNRYEYLYSCYYDPSKLTEDDFKHALYVESVGASHIERNGDERICYDIFDSNRIKSRYNVITHEKLYE